MAKNANIEIDSKLSLAGNIIVTAVSLVSVLPVLFKNMNADSNYTLVCAVLMLCSVLAAVFNIRKNKPAIRILPFLVFVDILVYFILFVSNINVYDDYMAFKEADVFGFLSYLKTESAAIIVPLNILILFTSVIVSIIDSDIFFSVVFSTEGILISLFCVWKDSSAYLYGRNVLSVSLIVIVLWIFICLYSSAARAGEKSGTSVYSFVVSLIIIAFNAYFANNSTEDLNEFFIIPERITSYFIGEMYPWWLVVLLTILFIAGGVLLAFLADRAAEKNVMGFVDAKLLFSGAAIIVLSKVLLSNYFSYSFVLYVCALFFLYIGIKKDMKHLYGIDKKACYYGVCEFVLKSAGVLYFCVCFILVIQVAKNALYLTLPIVLLIMFMLYRLAGNFIHKNILKDDSKKTLLSGLPNSYHSATVVIMAFLMLTLVYYYRLSIENISLIIIIALTALTIFILLKKPLPNNIKLPEINTAKWTVIGIITVVCIVINASSGVKVESEYNNIEYSTEIIVQTNRDSFIDNIEYSWNNSFIYDLYNYITGDEEPYFAENGFSRYNGYGYLSDDEEVENHSNKRVVMMNAATNEEKMVIPVEGERLTVCVTDSNGIKTKRTIWFPIWFDTAYDKK